MKIRDIALSMLLGLCACGSDALPGGGSIDSGDAGSADATDATLAADAGQPDSGALCICEGDDDDEAIEECQSRCVGVFEACWNQRCGHSHHGKHCARLWYRCFEQCKENR